MLNKKKSWKRCGEDTLTGYQKMIPILHQKDMTLLEASVADDHFWIYELKMWTKDDLLKQVSELFQTNSFETDFLNSHVDMKIRT